MKTIQSIITITVLLTLGIKCSSPKPPILPQGFEYIITQDKLDKGLDRRTIDVKVNQEVSEPTIKDLSVWIKESGEKSKNAIIFYKIENGKYIGNSWLRVDFNPDYHCEKIALPIL